MRTVLLHCNMARHGALSSLFHSESNMRITAVYPGTFDPITKGHVDVVARACSMFDEIKVAVASSPSKAPFFELQQRVELATNALRGLRNVKVISFSGLLVDCARENNASVIIRGLRAVSDFEFEVQLAGMNRRLSANIETVFIAASQEYAFLSSSLIREIARLGGDVTEFVPANVNAALVANS